MMKTLYVCNLKISNDRIFVAYQGPRKNSEGSVYLLCEGGYRIIPKQNCKGVNDRNVDT
jgi:hypothetical protein